MYSNAGKLIKKYVGIIVKINYVLAGIMAAIFVIMGLVSGSIVDFLVLLIIAAITFIVSCLAAWLWGMFVYAYGEMAERVISIDEKMDRLIPKPANAEQPKTAACSQEPKETRAMFCESCGSPISQNAKFCNKCGSAIK